MLKKWKWALAALGLVSAGVGTAVITKNKIDQKIADSDKFLNQAKKYVLENLDGDITSSYIYKDENEKLKGCISLLKDDHTFNYKFNIENDSVVFV